MSKVAKVALVTVNGKGIPADPDGTELEFGGYERANIAADLDPVAGFDETPVPSKLTFKPIARADFDPLELANITGGEILIEYDSGYKVKMAKAFCSAPPKKGGNEGHWSFEFMGSPVEKA